MRPGRKQGPLLYTARAERQRAELTDAYRAHYGVFVNYGHNLAGRYGTEATAEDLLHNAFWRAWAYAGRGSLENARSLLMFRMRQLAIKQMIARYRREKNLAAAAMDEKTFRGLPSGIRSRATGPRQPATCAVTPTIGKFFDAAAPLLLPREHKALYLHYVEGLPFTVLAGTFRRHESNVRGYVYSARKKLRCRPELRDILLGETG